MKIVEFKDGTYALRRYYLFHTAYMYLDLEFNDCWWERKDQFFNKCKGTLEQVKTIKQKMEDKGE